MSDHRQFEFSVDPERRVVVHLLFSDADDGDLRCGIDPERLQERRRSLVDLPWAWVDQVHRDRVVDVGAHPEQVGVEADALVSDAAAMVLSVQTADCAPVLMFAPVRGGAVVAAAHAGWRGLASGVLANAVQEVTLRAEAVPQWAIGPCICARHYEFGADDLDTMSQRCGTSVRSFTDEGAPALDLRAAVRSEMLRAGCGEPLGAEPVCTVESARHWSHRADGNPRRQVGAIWWEHHQADHRRSEHG